MTEKAPLAILMPKITDYERRKVRYGGLIDELGVRGTDYFFVESHSSYDATTSTFSNPVDIDRNPRLDISGAASVVRDFTMALRGESTFYDEASPLIAHHPDLDRFIASKDGFFLAAPELHPGTIICEQDGIAEAILATMGDKVVVKPIMGHRSKGVIVGTKQEVAEHAFEPGTYLVQEFIDTSNGMPEHNIVGVHNLRILSINNKAVGAIARVGGTAKDILAADVYGPVIELDQLGDGIQEIVDRVHSILGDLPGEGKNVIAIDIMRGVGADGEIRDLLCEVNRRPQRISMYDALDERNLDIPGIERLSKQWDIHEADMLTDLR